jgi:hypothetical protein
MSNHLTSRSIFVVILGVALASGTLTARQAMAGGSAHNATLPVEQIEQTVGAQGNVSNGVLDISIERTDIGDVHGPEGVTFTPSFEIHGDLYFQPLDNGQALLNGDMALLPEEVNPFITALLKHKLIFQAYHQHLIELTPPVWFVHFRGVSDPNTLAQEIHDAIQQATHTPLPQSSPSNPTTPLDANQLASILHGSAEVGDEGVVTVTVDRSHGVKLGGVYAEPTPEFPLRLSSSLWEALKLQLFRTSLWTGGSQSVVELMLTELNWFQGCLYNQEILEFPQLFFDHMLKVGDAYTLAQEIRQGLDKTDSE